MKMASPQLTGTNVVNLTDDDEQLVENVRVVLRTTIDWCLMIIVDRRNNRRVLFRITSRFFPSPKACTRSRADFMMLI